MFSKPTRETWNKCSSLRASSPRIDRGHATTSQRIKKRHYNKCFTEVSCSTRIVDYYSFKIFPRYWLVKTTRIIHYNQLLFTKYWTNDVKSAARCKLLNRWRQNDVESAARGRLLDRWSRKPGDKVVLFLVSRNSKERNSKTPFITGKCFEWIIKQLLNSAFVE